MAERIDIGRVATLIRGDATKPIDVAGPFDLVFTDPPWSYGKAQPPRNGRVDRHYATMSTRSIVEVLDSLYDRCTASGYLVVWCTMPFVVDFGRESKAMRWRPLAGGMWWKDDARRGIGYHGLGDCEPYLVFGKGRPRPAWLATNVVDDVGYRHARMAHSQKPPAIQSQLIERFCPRRGRVIDPFMGLGSAGVAAMQTGRRFVGVEISRSRFEQAASAIQGAL